MLDTGLSEFTFLPRSQRVVLKSLGVLSVESRKSFLNIMRSSLVARRLHGETTLYARTLSRLDPSYGPWLLHGRYGWPQDTYAGGWAGHVWHAHNSFYSVWMNDREYSQLQESTFQWHDVAIHLDYVHTIAFAVFR